MSSVTSPQQAGRGTADIPAPRGGQGVRLLVLGTELDAQELRDQAAAAGLELAQRYSARVSHVAYGSGIDPEDGRYTRIREAGLTLVSIQACAAELGLAPDADIAVDAENGKVSEVDEFHRVDAADEPLIMEQADLGVELTADAEGEPGDCLCAGDESLDFPPLQLSDSAESFVPGFQRDADVDAVFDTGVFAAVSADADADDHADVPHSRDETPLAAAVIGIDPWIGTGTATATEPTESSDASIVESGASTTPGIASAISPANGSADVPARAPQGHVLASLAWSLIPLATFGLLTPVSFGYAAFRMRSRALALVALGYTFAVLLSFVLSAAHPRSATPAHGTGALLTLALAVTWIGGTVHALSLRTKVFVS